MSQAQNHKGSILLCPRPKTTRGAYCCAPGLLAQREHTAVPQAQNHKGSILLCPRPKTTKGAYCCAPGHKPQGEHTVRPHLLCPIPLHSRVVCVLYCYTPGRPCPVLLCPTLLCGMGHSGIGHCDTGHSG